MILTPKHEDYISAIIETREDVVIAICEHYTHKNERLTFKKRHYLRDIYFDSSPYIAILKATQCGISEWLVVKAITKAMKSRSVFYVLPTWELKNRFVKNRMDRSILFSPYYQKIMNSENKSQSRSGIS